MHPDRYATGIMRLQHLTWCGPHVVTAAQGRLYNISPHSLRQRMCSSKAILVCTLQRAAIYQGQKLRMPDQRIAHVPTTATARTYRYCHATARTSPTREMQLTQSLLVMAARPRQRTPASSDGIFRLDLQVDSPSSWTIDCMYFNLACSISRSAAFVAVGLAKKRSNS
mmetsp:Transcript_7757/g.13177  ORF Transcript_7757/g.13177 Transcript_7757/m.13177 type:complete len:168 (-) Transcript_7757:584-1087(-)